MNDAMLGACRGGLENAGHSAELCPAGTYVEAERKPYSVIAFEVEPEQEVQ